MNYQTKLAFAYGACEKLASVGVHPADFVQAAAQSTDADAIKIAEAILELDHFEKNAASMRGVYEGGKEMLGRGANAARRAVGKTEVDYPGRTVNVQRAGAAGAPSPSEGSAMLDAMQAGPQGIGPNTQEFSDWMNANMGAGGGAPGGTQQAFGGAAAPPMRAGAGDLSRTQMPHDLPSGINYPSQFGPGHAAALAGAAGLGGAAGYGMGPADTFGNQMRGYANMIPGVDMQMQSRLNALLGG